jgi:transposase-like protein
VDPSAASIAGWVRQADAEDGKRPDVMTTAEREELSHLRREVHQLRRANGRKSAVRSKVEHVFAQQKARMRDAGEDH